MGSDDAPWDQLLLDAMAYPAAFSISYASDLRYLFQRRLLREATASGLPLKPMPRRELSRSKATIFECVPFIDPYGNLHDARFCFGYGVDNRLEEYSFTALNYRYDYRESHEPEAFLRKEMPLLLGNFGIAVRLPVSEMPQIAVPPELTLAGVTTVATAKNSCVFAWLGVRYNVEQCRSGVVQALSRCVLPAPLGGKKKPTTFLYGSAFFRDSAGNDHGLSPEEEAGLRTKMGYPPKGKPIRERILYDSACAIFGFDKVIRRYRGKEMQGLELDVWIPSCRLAFEYQGRQHHERVVHWQSEDEHQQQRERDKKKANLCSALGIKLIYFEECDGIDRASVIAVLRRTGIL